MSSPTNKSQSETAYVPRDQLSEAELRDALAECEKEPIHVPGLVQPHGVVIVMEHDSDKIVKVSENITDYFDVTLEKVIGSHLSKIIGKGQTQRINSIIRAYELQPLRSTMIEVDGNCFDAVVHYSGDHKILELEPCASQGDVSDEERVYEGLRDFATILQSVNDVDTLHDAVVKEIKNVTGFGRVKLYQFDEEWNGMVVAEERDERMPSYLGLNFPASDIPPQARALYAKNYLRLIPDIRYKPVQFYPKRIEGRKKPLDMSFCILRSVSPVHIQYLDNINVLASMSVSIMQNGKLWGLIACHHDAPLHVPYRLRVLSEIIGHIFSAKLSTLEQFEMLHRSATKTLLIEKMSSQLNTVLKANDILFGNHEIAMDALAADGMIIKTGEAMSTFGQVPKKKTLNKFLEWCSSTLEDNLIYTRHAQKFFADKNIDVDLKGGFLAVPIGIKGHDMAIWFRSPKTEKVKWAGDPEKPVEKTKAGHRLTPRASFELWQTTTEGKCPPWSDEDIGAAQSITHIILENAKIHAETANAAKTEFLSQMSHELRTPLGAITGIVEILARDKQLSVRHKELLRTLNVSSFSLLDLINDLLDISKIEAKEVAFSSEPFSMAQVLEDIRSLMKVKAHEKGLAFNVNYNKSDTLLFVGDAGKIKQVLVNLVNNAMKFTDQGFVNVMAHVDETSSKKANVTFEVVDSGIGISEENQKHIFNKFVQADPSITRRYGGTGLGLSISSNLVELMGGTISVDSKEGMGSKFSVTLPLRVERAPKKAKSTDREDQKNADQKPEKEVKERILLVEDYEGNIVVALYFLQEEGYEVVIAKNGKEAIQKLEKEHFDLVLMDVQMPIMDGLTATRIIKEKQKNGELPAIPIMGMTANALKEDKQKCLNAGMDEYISKPLSLDELSEKMENLLKNKG